MGVDLNKIESIFFAALKLPDPQRSEFIRKECVGDNALCARIEHMIAAKDNAVSFLEAGALDIDPTIDPALGNWDGSQIGSYKLREQIGEGGMGVVYVAEQTEPVRRKVALKIIKPGMASMDVLTRFEAERQALAMMDHPNIAKVYDGGATDSGQPYFVMELVQGLAITEYCDQHQVPTEDRLLLFATVCRAVQHAHQKGIIHRDLKPSNIIVSDIDDTAVPKVIDFGVAKAISHPLTEETLYTHFSQMVGTPLYMSPEQTGLGVIDIDTRSDVYSLGVLLYELLTGSTPFDSEALKQAGFDEMRRIIREDEPPRPSAMVSTLKAEALWTVSQRRGSDPRKLSDSLAGELDWLVMKALEKDRNRRYESPSALVADIERYLTGESLEACPPSAVYRLKKFATRNKAAITTAAAVLVTLLLGIAGTSWQAARATKALATADKNLELAEEQRTNALQNFRLARDTIDNYLDKLEQSKVLDNPDMLSLRHDLVQVARKYYSQFLAEQSDKPTIQADVAKAYERMGETLEDLGENDEARESLQKAIEIREKLAADDPEDLNLRNDLAESYVLIAEFLWNQLKLADRKASKDVYAHLKKAIEIRTPLKKPDHRSDLADTYRFRGDLHFWQWKATGSPRHRDEALAAFERANQIAQTLVSDTPDSEKYQESLAHAYNSLGRWHKWKGNKEESKSFYRKSLKIWKKLAEQDPDREVRQQLLAKAYKDLAGPNGFEQSMAIDKHLAEKNPSVDAYQVTLAWDFIRKASVESRKTGANLLWKLAERNPQSIKYQINYGDALLLLGNAQKDAGKLGEAITSYRKAISILEPLGERMQIREQIAVADALHGIAQAQEGLGRLDDAIDAIQQCLFRTEQLVNELPGQLRFRAAAASQHNMLARYLREADRPEQALAACQSAFDLLEAVQVEGKFTDAPPDQIAFAERERRFIHQEMALCQKALKESEAGNDGDSEVYENPESYHER